MTNATYRVSILCRQVGDLSTEYEVVSLGTQRDSDLPPKQNEGEDLSVLCSARYAFVDINIPCTTLETTERTFSLHLKKNSSGSLPYSGAEPIKGSQWKTSGGNDLSRGMTYTHKWSSKPCHIPYIYLDQEEDLPTV